VGWCARGAHAAVSAAGELGDALTQKVAAPLLKTLGHPMVGSHAVLLDAAAQTVYGFAGVVELPSARDWPPACRYW
jgi:hypothetical protein